MKESCILQLFDIEICYFDMNPLTLCRRSTECYQLANKLIQSLRRRRISKMNDFVQLMSCSTDRSEAQ